jgi:hypothetical protein
MDDMPTSPRYFGASGVMDVTILARTPIQMITRKLEH